MLVRRRRFRHSSYVDPTTDALRADLRQVGTLLRGYELIERAELIERLSEEDDDRLLLVASGPELWGGSGAVWEAEPFVHSHPDVASADTDYLEFQRAVVRISDRLDQVDLDSLSGRNADLFRRQLGEV